MSPGVEPVIGVLGGMGPAATVDFYAKLVAATPADVDQDHPKVVIWADPSIPDRTLALTAGGPDPTPWLLRGAEILRSAGATIIGIPCNTAHAFLPRIESRLGVPVVHMIDQAGCHLARMVPRVSRVGLLASTGTVQTGLYQDVLSRYGFTTVLPGAELQTGLVMPAIRAIKAGRAGPEVVGPLRVAADDLIAWGAQVVVAGCTEIPLVLRPDDVGCPFVDPAYLLARTLVEYARAATPAGLARPCTG
ncbi:aspartate/glutamate racemase family protein [Nocardia alni]|uniref:aspartate/glutamate racemase family protein n=1 Tax=Nocardia alni TaxID=2815723 RepID=UPI001C23E181|nr:amino acid racemase [Nocardia alni]